MSKRFGRLRSVLPGSRPPATVEEQAAARAGADDRFAGTVAVIIALATLLAAVAGLLQAETSELAEDDRLTATRLALEGSASAQREQQQAHVEYQIYIRSVEQGTSAGNAQLRSLLAEQGSLRQRQLQLEQQRWERLSELTLASSDISRQQELGPERDPTFPRRYFATARQESHRLNALQDAYNESANELDERGAAYTAILAVLAVSLYLFGLTVAVRERVLRLVFLGVGLMLMTAAGIWTAATAVQASAPVQEEAAAAYAAARVAGETAYDNAGHAEAVGLYDRAIELRPSFAQAYLGRASAQILAATPQRTGLVSVVPVEALRAGLADLERARRLGLATARSEGAYGFYSFLEGIQTNDRGVLERGLAATQRAIELDPGEPVYRLNLGVTLVALERFEQARLAYDEAVARVLFHDGDGARPRDEPWLEEIWLAGALTDLEVLLRHQPQLGGEVATVKEALVGRIGAGSLEPPAQSGVSIADVVLSVFPAQAQWQARLDGYDAGRDVISVQWYHRPVGTSDWAVIPEISGSEPPTEDPAGGWFKLSRYLGQTQPPACLSPGSYRAELYLNGRLALASEVEPQFGELDAAVARDVTLAFCRPADWQPLEDALPGLLQGYRSADGQHGVYAVRYDLPRSYSELETLLETMIGSTVQFPELFPAAPTFMEEVGTDTSYFLGLERTAWQWYDYGTGYVRAAAGLDRDGAVLLGLVYGPYEWFNGPQPDAIHSSMIIYE